MEPTYAWAVKGVCRLIIIAVTAMLMDCVKCEMGKWCELGIVWTACVVDRGQQHAFDGVDTLCVILHGC